MENYQADPNRSFPDFNQILEDRWDECLSRIFDELQEFELFRVRCSDPKSSLLDDVADIISQSGLSDGECIARIAELLRDNGYPVKRGS